MGEVISCVPDVDSHGDQRGCDYCGTGTYYFTERADNGRLWSYYETAHLSDCPTNAGTEQDLY